MLSTYGFNTLTILFLVYWSQGFKSISTLAITLYYKETLNLNPATTQIIKTLSIVAWFIKPFYGILSDNFPIYGYHRKSYLFILGILGIFSMISILLHKSVMLTVLSLTLSEFCQAFSDVIADALMVENSRKEEHGSSKLQSFSYIALAFGGISGSIFGGILLEYFSSGAIIAVSAVCPLLIVVCSFQLTEGKHSETNLKLQLTKLKDAILEPIVLKMLIFIVILSGTNPKYTELFTYYLRDVLKYSPTFMASLGVISYSTLIIGSAIYSKFLKSIQFRSIILYGQILLILINFCDLGLVLRVYELFGIPAWTFIVGEDVLGSIVAFTLKTMPILVLTARICPPGVEATFFAMFTSVYNVSMAISGLFGGFLIEAFGVKSGVYDMFWLLIVVQIATKFVPFMFLGMIPVLTQSDEDISEVELLKDKNLNDN